MIFRILSSFHDQLTLTRRKESGILKANKVDNLEKHLCL